MGKFGYGMNTQQAHYALLPEGEVAPEELESLLKDCHIDVIEFPVKGGSFEELTRLLLDLFRRTVQTATLPVRLPTDVSWFSESENLS